MKELTRICFYCKKDLSVTLRELAEREFIKCRHCGNKVFVTESWPKEGFFDCISIMRIKNNPQIGRMFISAIENMGD